MHPSTAHPSLTRGPHPGSGPRALHLTAVTIHAPAVARAAVALGRQVVSVLITLGHKQPRWAGPLCICRPRCSENVFSLQLAPGLLQLCQRQAKEGCGFGPGLLGVHTELRTYESFLNTMGCVSLLSKRLKHCDYVIDSTVKIIFFLLIQAVLLRKKNLKP